LKSRPFDAKFLEPLFTAGYSLIRLHKLEMDDNFLQSYSKILWQIGLALLVHGYEGSELVVKVAIVLTAEKLWGREKARELMTRLEIGERVLGEVNILVGQKPSFSK
jgi:hypothetical protein